MHGAYKAEPYRPVGETVSAVHKRRRKAFAKKFANTPIIVTFCLCQKWLRPVGCLEGAAYVVVDVTLYKRDKLAILPCSIETYCPVRLSVRSDTVVEDKPTPRNSKILS